MRNSEVGQQGLILLSPIHIEQNLLEPKFYELLSRKPVKITTELKTLAPEVNVISEAKVSVPALENTWEPIPQPGLQLESVAFMHRAEWYRKIPLGINSLEETSFWQYWVASLTEEMPVPQNLPQLEVDLSEKLSQPVEISISKVSEETPKIPYNELPVPGRHPIPRRPIGVLWNEVTRILKSGRTQINEALKREREETRRFLQKLQRKLDELVLVPAPARGAIHTGGRPPVRYAPRITAVVLNESWQPERTLSLPVMETPMIRDGQLKMVVKLKDPALIGRIADLVLVVEGFEVALCSAAIASGAEREEAELVFELNFSEAGIKVKDGKVPLDVLRVVIEPPLPPGDKGGK